MDVEHAPTRNGGHFKKETMYYLTTIARAPGRYIMPAYLTDPYMALRSDT